MQNRHPLPVAMEWAELRKGIADVFYPRVPAWDDATQKRIDRATDRVLAAAGYARTPAPDVVDEQLEEVATS